MVARDRDVVEEDLAVGRAPDARALAGGLEALPRPAAACAHDERRALDPEVLVLDVADLLGREGLRRLRRLLAAREQRAAARAVVRRLRVLEAALLAVDDAHRYAGGARLPRQDLGEPVDVDLVEHAAAARGLEARDELRAKDVDLAVQEAALVADLALLHFELVDQAFQVAVGQRAQIRERFHCAAFRRRSVI